MVPDRRRVARMRRVAVRALEACPLVDRELRLSLMRTTPRSGSLRGPDGRDRFLLRVHRPAVTPGTGRCRPGYLAHLDDFIATRKVAFGLWYTGTAQVSPLFRADLDQVQADIARSLDTLLRN